MIKVFSGDWRGLGVKDQGYFLMMEFKFREIMHHFTGAKLAVFLAIVLHSDKEGLSFPSYDLLKSETGYSRQTIATALNDLCALKINDQRVLMRYRVRDEQGKFTGSNRYLIFPTAEEIQRLEESDATESKEDPQSNNLTVDDGNHSQDFPPSKNLTLSINHSLSNNHLKDSLAEKSEPADQEPPARQTDAVKKGDILDGILHYSREEAHNLSEYPEDVRPVLEEFFRLWKVIPPTKSLNPSGYKLWLKEARAVRAVCAEFGLDLMKRYYKRWEKEGKKITIARIGSLVNVLSAEAGMARQEKPSEPEKYDPVVIASFQAKLKASKLQSADL